MPFFWSMLADRLSSGQSVIFLSTALTKSFASSSESNRPIVSATPKAVGQVVRLEEHVDA